MTKTFVLATGLACALLYAAPALAQSESFLLGPGSRVGPATEVKPSNCVTAPAWPAHPRWIRSFLELLGTRIAL